jgi:DNA-binding HxlR family transcriptional regulator
MLNRDYPDQNCSVARALELVGERWTLLIVRDALRGLTRFDQFQASLGVARNVLADRLGRLVAEGILERVRYSERPGRYEYVLTEKGKQLRVALAALRQWGDAYLSPQPPTLLRSKADGGPVVAAFVPADAANILSPDEVVSVPGPGA